MKKVIFIIATVAVLGFNLFDVSEEALTSYSTNNATAVALEQALAQ